MHSSNNNLPIYERGESIATLNSPISVQIISVGHTNFLVNVEFTWVQDPGSSPKSL